MEKLLELKDLSIGYRKGSVEKVLHRDLNLSLCCGELTTLMGVNGSGKSTLIRTICGFIPKLGGEVILDGKRLEFYTKEKLSTILSVVLTDRVSDGGLTVYEVVSLGRYPYTGFFGRLSSKDKIVIEQSLNDVGVWDMRERYISELSDGERQKVMIAKSIAQESKIIILDEPTSFLDVRSRMDTVALLRRLASDKKMAFLLSLHDLELSLQYSDNIWILRKGAGMVCGTTENIIMSGDINKAVDCRSDLYFDFEFGSFRSSEKAAHRIRLEGVDLLWVRNALSRIGYSYDSSASDILYVNSYHDLTLESQGECYHADSLSEMVTLIKAVLLKIY